MHPARFLILDSEDGALDCWGADFTISLINLELHGALD